MQSSDPSNAIKELEGIFQLLSAHPEFHVASVRPSQVLIRATPALGRVLKQVLSLRFCAEFGRSLTLVSFRVRLEDASAITLNLLWHVESVVADCSVFIHFTDETGAIRFQGDHPLLSGHSSPLRLLSSQNRIPAPQDFRRRVYHVRLGVWSPATGMHLHLTKLRGGTRDSSHGYPNAVILGSYYI
jgi:hypothetical protein